VLSVDDLASSAQQSFSSCFLDDVTLIEIERLKVLMVYFLMIIRGINH